MIIDTLSTFADQKALSGTTTSGEALHVGKIGFGNSPLYLVTRNAGAITGATSVALEGSADGSSGWKTLAEAAVTDLTDGGGVKLAIPEVVPEYLRVTVKGASMTGKISAFAVLQAESPRGGRIGDYEAQNRS